MRLKKQLFLTTLILSFTLIGPVQAVTASEINQNNQPVKTTMRLTNDGKSDLQELISRVDSQAGTSSSEAEKQPSEPASSESKVAPSSETASSAAKSESQSKQPSSKQPSSKPATSVVADKAQATSHPQLKATPPIIGTYGTSIYTLDLDTGVLTFDGGELDTGAIYSSNTFNAHQSAITEIKFRNNVSLPEDATQMFTQLKALKKFDSSNLDTTKVTNMLQMFSYTGSYDSVLDLSNFDTTQVTNMSYMFYYSPVSTLDLSYFDTSEVTNMNYMFYQSKVLTLDLSHFVFNLNCSADAMLHNDSTWKLTLPQQTFSSSFIRDPTKGDSIPGTDQYVAGTQWQIVGTGSDHQPAGDKLRGDDIPNNPRTEPTTYVWEHVEKWRGVNGNSPWYLNPDTGVLTFYQATGSSPTVLGERVSENLFKQFGGSWLSREVTEIKFEDEVALSADSALFFSELANLKSFDATNLDTSNVTNMDQMFVSDNSLTTLDLQGFNTEKVKNMSMMFAFTSSLTTLTLSSFNTENVEDMSAMFLMTSFKQLDVSKFDTAKVENMQLMFAGSSLETLDLSSFDLANMEELPEDYYGFGTSPVAYMFASANTLDFDVDKDSSLWQVKLGENTIFPADPGFEAAPEAGTTIPGTSYVTNDAAWQIVGNGTVLNPRGDKVSTTEMWDNTVRPVTYVWANKNQASPSIVSVDSLNFGELNLANTTLTPSATNMTTGNLKLGDLAGVYQVTVSQADKWVIDDETTISSNDLPIKYGGISLASGATPFVAGNETTVERDIKFDHDSSKQFILDLRGNANLQAVLGKSLTTTLTWSLSDTPES